MAADPTGQVGWGPLPVTPEPVFDSKDVETYLGEVTHDLMVDIGGQRRGIGWAATLFRLGKGHALAASTEQAREADREQCSFSDGPVMEAVRSGEFVLVSDLGLDRRWPGYSSIAAGHGVQSLLAVPILSEGGTSAAISLYAPAPHMFTSDDLVSSRRYARQVARALRVVLHVAERAEATAGLAVVQSSLVLVDLAVRSLMNEYGLTREGALRFLQTQALHHEVDLRDAALSVVAPSGMDRGPAQPAGLRQEAYDGVAELPRPSAAGRDFPTGTSPRRDAGAGREPPPAAKGRTA
ncbi:GAF domain-containing protein [Arthrobacter sp. SLBN-53]|uniref:GAF domain-containing protein n=1 Tax=unclassified Pseudarthrobacter TaxID=2647000 RepID=UPI001150958B